VQRWKNVRRAGTIVEFHDCSKDGFYLGVPHANRAVHLHRCFTHAGRAGSFYYYKFLQGRVGVFANDRIQFYSSMQPAARGSVTVGKWQ
jgi:hypothetical protein